MKKNESIPDDAIVVFADGDQWCCTFSDFINLQESPAGFGSTLDGAFEDLIQQLARQPEEALKVLKAINKKIKKHLTFYR